MKENREELIKEFIKQPTDGLLYDLDLLPEQCTNAVNVLRCEVVTALKNEVDRLSADIQTNE